MYRVVLSVCLVQLWKKSGAWLSNKLPVIHVSEEELEKAQQQRQMVGGGGGHNLTVVVPWPHPSFPLSLCVALYPSYPKL